MRISARVGRNTRLSMGPLGWVVFGAFVLAGWVVYGVAWVLAAVARLAAAGVLAAVRAVRRR